MRTRKTIVILIAGKAGSGKTTIKDILVKKLSEISGIEVFPYAFANPLKYMALAYFGWDKQKDDRVRKLLQDIGRIGREYDENIWATHFLNQLDKHPTVLLANFAIIDDWRFPNELVHLQKNPLLDIVTIRVFGRGGLKGDVAFDISENSLVEAVGEWLSDGYNKEPYNLGYDYTIDNEGNLELLNSKLEIILAEIKNKYIIE